MDDAVEAVYVSDDDYDPDTCVTAGELRGRGFPVAIDIPDVAWIHRSAIRAIQQDVAQQQDGSFDATIEISYLEAFRWVEGVYEVEAKP